VLEDPSIGSFMKVSLTTLQKDELIYHLLFHICSIKKYNSKKKRKILFSEYIPISPDPEVGYFAVMLTVIAMRF
jgi:hypothetical protein